MIRDPQITLSRAKDTRETNNPIKSDIILFINV